MTDAQKIEQLLRDGSRCDSAGKYCRECKHYGTHKVGRCNWEAATAEMLIAHGVTVRGENHDKQ